MKKISLFLILIFISIFLINIKGVSAKILTIEEVSKGFNQSPTIVELNEFGAGIISKVNSDNDSLDIYVENEKVFAFKYGDDYIEFDNRNNNPTKENVDENFTAMIFTAALTEAIFELSGYKNKTISEEEVFSSYDTYGIQIEVERYEFNDSSDGGTSSISGDYIKYFKISLDTEKIDALIAEYGADIEIENEKEYSDAVLSLVPKVEAKDITENSAVIYASVSSNDVDVPENVMCFVYRSTSKEGEYQKISDWAYNCSGGIGLTDEGLTPGTTYYYKAVIMSGTNYSEPIAVTTKGKALQKDEVVENPKTGICSCTIYILGGILLFGGICYRLKKKNIIPNI